MYGFGEGIEERNIPGTLFSLPIFAIHAKNVVTTLESALVLMVGNDTGTLALALQGLGARHVGYGVQPVHYGVVETALLRTLEFGLGDHWTPKLRKEWAAVFKFVAKAMMSGSENELEIVKEQEKAKSRARWATLRLNLIEKSEGTSIHLPETSSRFEDTAEITEPFEDEARKIDPPKLPNRRGAMDEAQFHSDPPRIPKRSSDPLIKTSVGEDYWLDAPSIHSADPPRIPRRSSDPIIASTFQEENADLVDSQDVNGFDGEAVIRGGNSKIDGTPTIPRRFDVDSPAGGLTRGGPSYICNLVRNMSITSS